MDIVIEFNNVSKKFKKGKKLLLKEALLDIFKPDKTEDFWALKDLNFKVHKGETLGIIGVNGSGKSTILKLIAGVLFPDKGKIKINGRIVPLIELGAGFHPELSGRENVYLNGSILGFKRSDIDKKFRQIVDFAELWDFMDTPVKHYSSGMYMRLGFAVAIHSNPDILLVDEILAVGDVSFQEKCINRMQEFKKRGKTIIFISHNLDLVQSFCSRLIFVDSGKIVLQGDVDLVIEKFRKTLGQNAILLKK